MNEWPSSTLGELYEIARGGSPRPIKSFVTTAPDGLNWIRIGDAPPGSKYIFKTEQKIKPSGLKKSRLVNEGDFILSNSMSFGRPYIMRTTGCIHDGWLVLKPREKSFDQNFAYYLLGSPLIFQQFDQLAGGSVVRNLNSDLVRGVTVPVPPLSEQERIVGILDEAFEGIATATAHAERNLHNARELFQSVLQSTFRQKGEDWVETTVGEICEITHGFAFKGPDFAKSADPELPIVLTPGDFTEDARLDFDRENTKRLTSSPPKDYTFEKGDLVVVMTDLSSKMKILGKPAFIERENVLHNQRIGRVVFRNAEVDKRFLYYYFRTPHFLEGVKSSATGTMVKHTAPKRICAAVLSYPESFATQQAIVAKLDALSAETRRLEAIYERKLAALAELKQSLLHRAFSGKL